MKFGIKNNYSISNKVIVSITLFMLMGFLYACSSVESYNDMAMSDNTLEKISTIENLNSIDKEEFNDTKTYTVEEEYLYDEEAIIYEYIDKEDAIIIEDIEDDNATKPVEMVEVENIATRSEVDKFYFAGDVYFSRKVKEAYEENGLNGIIDKNYLGLLKSGNFNIANLECAITNSTASEADKTYTLYTPEKYVKVIKDVGFDAMTIANNHVLDYGEDAFLNTMDVLSANDIKYVGGDIDKYKAKDPLIQEINGKKYAIFAASAVLPNDKWKAGVDHPGVNNGYDIATICKDIEVIKKEVDKVIVYMHWGEELSYQSNDTQKNYAHKLVDFGADLVVGSHPHIVQEIEYYKNVPIVYSLGNFIYGATKKDTILLEAAFDYSVIPTGALQLRVYPGLSNYEQVKYYWRDEELKVKCKELQDKCDTCYIGDNGYVFTVAQVEAAFKALASSSEIN